VHQGQLVVVAALSHKVLTCLLQHSVHSSTLFAARCAFPLCVQVEGEGVDVAGRPADGVEDTRDVAPSSLPPGVKYFRDRKLVRRPLAVWGFVGGVGATGRRAADRPTF
jgi:hypothetical protein